MNSLSHEDLPAELLISIFHDAHRESVKEFHSTLVDDPFEKKWFLRPELFQPRFPDALAQVSPRWDSIMAFIPDFWTTLVIIIDAPKPIDVSAIQSYFDRSADLPLDIVITRRPGSPRPSAEEERAALSPVLPLLNRFVHRFQSLSIYTMHGSTLPKLGHDLVGIFNDLITLRLEFEFDDGGPSYATVGQSIYLPKVSKLTLDGHNFLNITSVNRTAWVQQFPNVKHLSLVRLKPIKSGSANDSRILLYDFLDVASTSLNLDYLRLCDFVLTNPFSEELFVELRLGSALILEDLPRAFVHEFLFPVTLQTPELHVTRCSLNAMGRIPGVSILRLEEIAEFDDLASHLKNWNGTTLTLVRCSGFNDEFLEMLGAVSTYTGAIHLAKLTVEDCPGFTVEALKKMVESRNKRVGVADGDEWPGRPAIEQISVTGKGPKLEAVDAEWLRGRIKHLVWKVGCA